MSSPTPQQPILRAKTSSTRPLYMLLRCINFASKVHVEISESGIRLSADNARVMQGKEASLVPAIRRRTILTENPRICRAG
ncbi:hypothetical protein IMZ48_22770 [Candidatus Bathyarchaeota archaeon]|nr:hypothetical protein [Candidatus Bathyarchaeota archaeon]